VISHLPQLVVSALMHVAGSRSGAEGLALAGAGLRDTTRLAGSPPGIWHDIMETNHANIAESLDAMIAVLTRLRDDGSGEVLRAVFESAALWKGRLGGNGGNGGTE
jgi:prephenate dehydrogenase